MVIFSFYKILKMAVSENKEKKKNALKSWYAANRIRGEATLGDFHLLFQPAISQIDRLSMNKHLRRQTS